MEFKDTESQLEGIREIFAEAKREDDWNLDEPMLYSYYFVGKDADKLDELGEKLDGQEYDFVGILNSATRKPKNQPASICCTLTAKKNTRPKRSRRETLNSPGSPPNPKSLTTAGNSAKSANTMRSLKTTTKTNKKTVTNFIITNYELKTADLIRNSFFCDCS